jgi:hypothetical protein
LAFKAAGVVIEGLKNPILVGTCERLLSHAPGLEQSEARRVGGVRCVTNVNVMYNGS